MNKEKSFIARGQKKGTVEKRRVSLSSVRKSMEETIKDLDQQLNLKNSDHVKEILKDAIDAVKGENKFFDELPPEGKDISRRVRSADIIDQIGKTRVRIAKIERSIERQKEVEMK
jgi:hypothetical protein